MRTAFINQLIEEAKTNPDIFLLVGDLGYSVVEPFAELFPDRFLNVGIAEQNMTGIAAGLAKEGYNVFTYSIGNFPTLRAIEQIRYDVAYHYASVKIVAVGAGYAYGPLGTSHHTTEDIGMLRTIPDLDVLSPADPVEAMQITQAICNNRRPTYLRLGKAGEPKLHTENTIVPFGKIIPVRSGQHTAILATGSILQVAKAYGETNGYSVYSVPFIKPFDIEGLATIAATHERLITIEEHQKSGGLGSVVLENINDLLEENKLQKPPIIKRVAIPDTFIPYAGSQDFLRKAAGLVL